MFASDFERKFGSDRPHNLAIGPGGGAMIQCLPSVALL